MHTYRIELIVPGTIFDSISVLLIPARSWAHATGTAKRLVHIRKAHEQVLAVRRIQ